MQGAHSHKPKPRLATQAMQAHTTLVIVQSCGGALCTRAVVSRQEPACGSTWPQTALTLFPSNGAPENGDALMATDTKKFEATGGSTKLYCSRNAETSQLMMLAAGSHHRTKKKGKSARTARD
jgi:hypothetical protein